MGRVIRLVRLFRVLKIYELRFWGKKKAEEKKDSNAGLTRYAMRHVKVVKRASYVDPKDVRAAIGDAEPLPESKVGAALAELTIRRVIICVLFMLLIFDLISYHEVDGANAAGVSVLHSVAEHTYGDDSLTISSIRHSSSMKNRPQIWSSMRLFEAPLRCTRFFQLAGLFHRT